MVLACAMKKHFIQFALVFIGVCISMYVSVFVAGIGSEIYSPHATSNDDLMEKYFIGFLISSLVLGSLLGYLGFKLGGRLFKSDQA